MNADAFKRLMKSKNKLNKNRIHENRVNTFFENRQELKY